MLWFPGNMNVLGAVKVMGLMRNVLHSHSTNSAHNIKRDIAAPIHMHRDANPREEDHHCSNKWFTNLKDMSSPLLFGSADLCSCLVSAGIRRIHNLPFQTCFSQRSSIRQSHDAKA